MTRQLIPQNAISDFLGKELIKTQYFIFDLWMIIHLLAGFGLAYFLDDWKKVLLILIIWEIFEFTLWKVAFKQEPYINILWDIIFGMIGFAIMRILITRGIL